MSMIEFPPPEDAMITPPWLWWVRRGGTSGQLAGMAVPPNDLDLSSLADQGLDTIVSLIGKPAYDPAPLDSYSFSLHDLSAGGLPPEVEAEEREVEAAVAKVGVLLADGRNVVVHCHAGIGRTGTVIAGVLAAQGHRPEDFLPWLNAVQLRRTGGREGWPESEWQLRMLERFARRDGNQ